MQTVEKSRSKVWEYFKKSDDFKMSKMAICTMCKGKVKCANSYTTGLLKHLKNHHKYVYTSNFVSLPKQHTLDGKIFGIRNQVSSQLITESCLEQVREHMCNFVVEGLHSFQIVEERGFKNLLETVQRLPKE